MSETLCQSCQYVREIITGTGSRFLLCRRSQDDPRYTKYPPQPVSACEGYERAETEPPAIRDLGR